MANSYYNFFRTETPDGIDYLFITQNNRVYTVSFDPSLYGEYTESFPTLSTHGYGLIFSYKDGSKKVIGRNNGARNYCDSSVGVTICEIISDFLKNSEEPVFVILQCEKYKEEKFFHPWYKNYSEHSKYKGIGIEFDFVDEKQYFGFICKIDNANIEKAVVELETFSFEISKND